MKITRLGNNNAVNSALIAQNDDAPILTVVYHDNSYRDSDVSQCTVVSLMCGLERDSHMHEGKVCNTNALLRRGSPSASASIVLIGSDCPIWL